MARLASTPVGNRWSRPTQIEEEEKDLFVAQIAGGINSYIDPADIQDGQLQVATNARISGDLISRRLGTSDDAFAPQGSPADNLPILQISRFARFDGTSIFVQFNEEKLFRRTPASWDEITGAGFTVNQRQKTIAINDRFFFSTGMDPIQEIDFATDTYADLGNAPKYKYICGFGDRVVGANLYDATNPNPIQLGWSGNLNFDVWDTITDQSAGNVALVQGEGDYSDEITGLFGFASVMLICRQRSLWIASRRAVPTAPFIFTAAYPNVGCDCPDSIAKTRNGITWYDFRTNQVYTFEVGGAPVPIGFNIRKDLKRIISDNTIIQGSYDPIGNRYHLCIPSTNSDLTSVFVYDFESKSWVMDERYQVYGVFPVDEISTDLMIDELDGMINDLVGMINDLSEVSITPSVITYGHIDGILTQDDVASDDDNGRDFEMNLISKNFQIPPRDVTVSRLLLKVVPRRLNSTGNGNASLYYSRNGGKSFSLYKTVTFTIGDLNTRNVLTFPKQITSAEYVWKLISDSGSFDLLEYRIAAVSTGETRHGSTG